VLLRMSASALDAFMQSSSGAVHSPLTELLIERHLEVKGTRAKPGDIKSWENSIPVVVRMLVDLGLGDVEVLIEFDLPHTDSPVDLVLCGLHPGSGEPSYVAVELKQVRAASLHPGCPVIADLGYRVGKTEVIKYKVHPVRQVQRYCDFMTRYLEPLSRNDQWLVGAALMHNATRTQVEELFALPENLHGALFTGEDLPAFRRLLTSRLDHRSGQEAAAALVAAKKSPLPKLTDIARGQSVADGGLTLLDEQYMGFELVLRRIERVAADNTAGSDPGPKTVFIFRGGPGSGKSAVALELQRVLGLRMYEAPLASGSHAYTETLRDIMVGQARRGEVARKRAASLRKYRYFNSFTKSEQDEFDVLICDEAHRIRRNSTGQWTSKAERDQDRPQLDELLRVAKVPVFLLDDHQSIRPDEVGTTAYLKEFARKAGYRVEVQELRNLYRSGGSRRYQLWVQRLLGLDDVDHESWEPDGRMHLLVAESPEHLERFVQARHLEGATARITAGFCWRWSKPEGGQLVPDVQIAGWHRPWNVKPEHSVPGAPSANLWATDPRGIDQIGCVYTAQTFEYDWNAVIIGPDLLWRDGRFVVDRSASKDPAFKKRTPDEAVERCIRNAYHVLLTRGVMGTVVYSPDDETQQALRRLIPGSISEAQASGAAGLALTVEGSAVPRGYR